MSTTITVTGFIPNKKNQGKIALPEYNVSNVVILLLVEEMTIDIEKEIENKRKGDRGIVRRISKENNIQSLIHAIPTKNFIIISDEKNKNEADKISKTLQNNGMNLC